MDEKRKKRIKTVVEDVALFTVLPADKKSQDDEKINENDFDNQEDESTNEDSIFENDKSSDDILSIEEEIEYIHSSSNDWKDNYSSIKTLIYHENYDEEESFELSLNDDLFSEDELINDIDVYDGDMIDEMDEEIVNAISISKNNHFLKKGLHGAGKTAMVFNRTTRTVRRLQEGKYTTDSNELLKSMGKTAVAPIKRKARKTVIKKSKKIIFKNPVSQAIIRVFKRFFKAIIHQICLILSTLFGVSLPIICVIALLLSIFGMGGYDSSVITSYEKYMLEINQENTDYVDEYREKNSNVEIYSSQGNDYGFVNWRAVIASVQILYGYDLSYSQKEQNFLKELKENKLYERYEEKEETRTIKDENGNEQRTTIKILTIVNPGINDFIDFLKEKHNLSKLDEKSIRTLYVSSDLMSAFSDTISGVHGGGKVFDDQKIQNLFDEGEKYLGRPYVWGGSSPSTGFDCSGFICYVYTTSKTYNLPRTTAQGIYNQCIPISEEEAKPGDLVFFQGTYDTPNTVTHIGIYAGDDQMLHCGDPIQYASFKTKYWKNHFYGFGRLK